LDTVGTNMMGTLALPYIDSKRTYSNDVREVCNVLGMEAARQVLFNEFSEVMSFAGLSVNYHHLNLLCNRMTMSSEMTPIFRSGLLNDDIGPIAKATFEVQTEVLLTASRHADFDHMRGVSANVMCGQYGNYGTGAFNVLLDMNQMKQLSDVEEDKSKTIDEMFDLKADTLECDKANIEIKNNLFNIKPTDTNVCDDDYNMGF
jgi:DNA-directed RNA polymerase II subunit RPB1